MKKKNHVIQEMFVIDGIVNRRLVADIVKCIPIVIKIYLLRMFLLCTLVFKIC